MKKTPNKPIESVNLSLLTLATRQLGLWIALGATLLSAAVQADVVTDWNQITLATQAAVPGGVRTPPAARALAMVHLAIFDSVNAIDRRFTPYAVQALADPAASPEAATVAAAHAVLVNVYPGRQAALEAAYATSLASIADGSSKSCGVALGESAAAVIVALRSADGSAVTLLPGGGCCRSEPYTVAPGPGVYQPDPAPLFVAWGNVTPFALQSGSQFRMDG